MEKSVLLKKCRATVAVALTMVFAWAQSAVAAPQPTESSIRQRVQQMQAVEYDGQDQILSARLRQALEYAHSIPNISEDDSYVGFEWNAGVLDVCGDKEPQVKISSVDIVDNSHANVVMQYIDLPCYDITYTLNLVVEGGEWKIDDVHYYFDNVEVSTLTGQCQAYYEQHAEAYTTESIDVALETLLAYEPLEENYTDPATIYYNNPKEINRLIDQINNGHTLLKKNPGYTPAMGKKIDAMVARIKRHL